MTQRHSESGKSEWEQYLHQKALAVDAAQRARLTHRDRRAQESAYGGIRRAAIIDQSMNDR
jgi:hypothetical protein